MKIKFQISKFFVGFEQNCEIFKSILQTENLFSKFFLICYQIVLRNCNKKYSITSSPIFNTEGGVEAET